MNARDRDIHDAADGELRAAAIENITHRIISGKSRIGVFELLDCEINSERYKILLEEITTILLNESMEREYLADQMVAGLIERYIAAHDDLVEEEAATIEHYEQEEA